MADDRQVNITIKSTYDGKGEVDAKKGLKSVEAQAKQTGQATQTAGEKGADGFNSMATSVGKALAALAAAKGILDFFSSSVSLANENARAVNTLAAAYQAVGYTAQGAMKQAQEFATKMQNLTGIADEAFLNAQRLLANYGVVGAKAQEAIQAAYALSIGRSIDFASAMDLVAKAATGQTSALSRQGIVLKDNIKESEKFDAVLAKINEQFGAVAQAAMGDSTTKLNALKQSWGDFKEQVGAGLNEGLVPAVDFLTKAVGWLNDAFKRAGAVFAVVFDQILIELQKAKTGFLALAEFAVKSFEPLVKLLSYIPKYGDKIQAAFDGAQKSVTKMQEQSQAQLEVMQKIRAPISDIWKTEKGITEEEEKQRALNEQKVNSNRENLKSAKEIKAEQKAITEEYKKQLKALDNIGLSTSKDLKGWERDEQNSVQGPTALEEFAGGGSSLANAADAVTQYQAEEERLANLRDLKQQYIEQEITDEDLKQQALANLQTQYDTQRLANDKNQAKARQQVYASMWGALTSLATSENKKVAAVGKVASIAQATMSMFTGAAKALELPFPANLAAAATVLAQGAALVSQIQAVKLADGGLVKAVTGGVPAVVGEGGSDEAVLPLDNARAMQRIGGAIAEQGGQMGPTVNVYVQTQATGGVEAILEQLTEASRNGVVQALEFANLNYKVGSQQQGYSV